MKANAIYRGATLPWIITALLVTTAGCGLKLRRINTSVQRPSNIAVYFAVETHNGFPVAGLEAKKFRIYEGGQLISPYESKQTILNPDVAVSHDILLLLDLSGSIVQSGSLPNLIAAANIFAGRVAKKNKVAVYGFDGRKQLIPLVSFTSDIATVQSGLDRLKSHKVRDPSTNLNGALVHATTALEKQMAHATQPLRFGTIVVFTDGTDRAHRITAKQMFERLDKSSVNVFVIGLGAEIDGSQLSRIGRDGFVKATDKQSMTNAFTRVAQRIEAAGRKFYLLSYCSPARAGKHRLRIEVTYDGKSGSLEHEFDARGFGPNCDPKRKPSFSLRQVRLKK
ncbi:MAG: VWA domain-containing protein [bacterium]